MANLKSNALLLDLLPYELPLIYSNEGLYKHVNTNSEWGRFEISKNSLEDTQPFEFSIFKNELTTRQLSLMHPLAQLQNLKFLEKYDQEIISFFQTNSIFSIRFPNGINSIRFKPINKIKSEMNFLLNDKFELNNNESQKYLDSYFSKERYKKITDFYKSNQFKKLETKYSLLQKLDISNCFYNIYTHSIDWAYLGSKEYAKKNKQGTRLSSTLDKVMTTSNYGETNGILVGPEFSRIVAEIVLTRIDKLAYEKIKQNNLYYKKDYEIVRYIDDIFIFTNSYSKAEIIKKIYIQECHKFKLSINESKAFIETNPFLKQHIWVVKLKKYLKEYFLIFENHELLNKINVRRATNSFLEEIRSLIIEFENDKHSIVSFILSSLEKVWGNLVSNALNKMKNSDNKSYILFKFVDLIHYILTFSLTASNVIKYSKLTVFLTNEANIIMDKSIEELIYSRTVEIIKYHGDKTTEILNLIIILKSFEKEIPENVLLDILRSDANYFSLSALTYYINEGNRAFRYKKIKRYINDMIGETIESINEKYILPNTNKKKIKELITSGEFILIHDFYSSKIINKTNKVEIERIKKKVNSHQWDLEKEKTINFLMGYMQNFDKPFMNWNTSKNDIIKVLVEKTVNLEQGY
jgi:Reverse transcriptase (RNA-dependent DNA polymerase)